MWVVIMKPKPFDTRVVVLMTKEMKEKLQILAAESFVDDDGGATPKMGRYVRLCIHRMWDERERKEGIR